MVKVNKIYLKIFISGVLSALTSPMQMKVAAQIKAKADTSTQMRSSGNGGVGSLRGDEDPDMFNAEQLDGTASGSDRDALAIDGAIHGWWRTSMQNHEQRIQWWREAKFGMFIHWGVYALAGGEWNGEKVGGYAEHLMRKEKISRKAYLDLAHQFNPEEFDAEAWVRAAAQSGMRYFIITAKHHDGFAMYPSQVSDFNITAQTAFKQDPMAALSAACRKYGLKFGFYYSHAFDWEDPDAPGNDWEYKNPGGDLQLYGGREWYNLHPALLRKAQKYVNDKAIPQIIELIKNYHPDILWFDTPHKLPLSENLRILQAIRQVDSTVVVNGRLVRSASRNYGDYQNTADRPAEFFPAQGDWEAIPTTNESYGYSKFDHSHKPASHFIRLLANGVSRGGNLLMNIGPMGNGRMAPEDLHILSGIGEWMAKNGQSIYGTTATPLPMQSWGVSTYKPGKLYLQVFDYPKDGRLYVGGLLSRCARAFLLTDSSRSLPLTSITNEVLEIRLPKVAPDSVSTVVVLTLDSPEKMDSVRYLAPNSENLRLLAFDAHLASKELGLGFDFRFGDGKKDRYYVGGWKDRLQTVSWQFKNSRPADYKLVLKFIRNKATGGSFKVMVDGVTLRQLRIEPTVKGEAIEDLPLGALTLDSGLHKIVLQPVTIDQAELMRPLELNLYRNQ